MPRIKQIAPEIDEETIDLEWEKQKEPVVVVSKVYNKELGITYSITCTAVPVKPPKLN